MASRDEERGLGHSVRYVARRLKLSTWTLRQHLVPLAGEDAATWNYDTGDVPYIALGTRRYVPRWWLAEMLRRFNGEAAA